MTDLELRTAVESMWLRRCAVQGLKHGSKAYRTAEIEYFSGAMVAINALRPNDDPSTMSKAVPAWWVLAPMMDRAIMDDEITEMSDDERRDAADSIRRIADAFNDEHDEGTKQ